MFCLIAFQWYVETCWNGWMNGQSSFYTTIFHPRWYMVKIIPGDVSVVKGTCISINLWVIWYDQTVFQNITKRKTWWYLMTYQCRFIYKYGATICRKLVCCLLWISLIKRNFPFWTWSIVLGARMAHWHNLLSGSHVRDDTIWNTCLENVCGCSCSAGPCGFHVCAYDNVIVSKKTIACITIHQNSLFLVDVAMLLHLSLYSRFPWRSCVGRSRSLSIMPPSIRGKNNWRIVLLPSAMMTSSNGNFVRVTGHLCREFTGPRWIPHTKASDAELWCFLWSASE